MPAPSGSSAGESVAVERDCAIPAPPPAANVQVARDITYAVMGGQPQRLDVAWPRGEGPFPLVVLIHGGGWSGGDKSDYHSAMRLLAGQGYAAASVNYRLASAPRNIFPAAVEDVRCAVRWLRLNAATYRVDPARIAALGHSAGGHLSAMLGTAAEVEGLDGACPARGVSPAVSAVVSLAGPQDIRTAGALDPSQRGMVENFLGGRPEDRIEVALLASPAVHVDARTPPFLLIHGTADPIDVPAESVERNVAAARSAGVPADVRYCQGGGHGDLIDVCPDEWGEWAVDFFSRSLASRSAGP